MSKIPTFFIDGVEHRLIFRTRYEKEEGYLDPFEIYENVLQIRVGKIFRRWKDVEVENVPGHVIIERGVYGFSSWKSNLLEKYSEYSKMDIKKMDIVFTKDEEDGYE